MRRYKSKRVVQEKRYKKITLMLALLVVLAVLANAVIFVAFSKFSRIEQFTVTGLKKTEDPKEFIDQMKAQVHNHASIRLLGEDNYFAWSKDFNYSNPQYKEVSMQKSFKEKSINFFVKLRERYAIWCKLELETGVENCRWIDKDGVAFESAPSTSGQIIPSVSEYVELAEFSPGSQIADITIFRRIEDILNSTVNLGINKESTLIERSLQELHIETTQDTKLVFSLRFDPKPTALPALTRFAKDPGLNFFSEINLAVEGRAFTTTK